MFIHTIAKPNAGKERKMASKYSNITVKGFRRENGRVGVRNHVLILPVDDISNAASAKSMFKFVEMSQKSLQICENLQW